MSTAARRSLVDRTEAIALMQLPEADFQSLVDTGQLAEISIRGHKRFDTKDLYALIDDYKVTQTRRTN